MWFLAHSSSSGYPPSSSCMPHNDGIIFIVERRLPRGPKVSPSLFGPMDPSCWPCTVLSALSGGPLVPSVPQGNRCLEDYLWPLSAPTAMPKSHRCYLYNVLDLPVGVSVILALAHCYSSLATSCQLWLLVLSWLYQPQLSPWISLWAPGPCFSAWALGPLRSQT